MQEFREAVEARDLDWVGELLAEDVVFTSPVAFEPYRGKPITQAILSHVIEVLEGFTYQREITDGADSALVFTATVGGRAITGCDFIRVDENGRISDFMVMVRPLSAATKLAEAMGARYEQIVADASALAGADTGR